MYRELAFYLALRDFKLRYKQTVFGIAWAVIQPLAGVVVFGRLARLPSESIPYPLFVYVGLSVWTYVATSVNAAAESLVANRALVTRVYFPRVLAPFAAVLPGLVDLIISLSIVAIFLVYYDVLPSLAILFLPFWVIFASAVTIGVGLWLSALNVLYRDVRYTLSFLLQLWLFLSPIVFPSSLVDGGWRFVYALNPLVGVIDGFRWSLVAAPGPGIEHLASLAGGLVLLITGAAYFRRVERQFADRI
jgi:lipopolysaccharide transport system permease protein